MPPRTVALIGAVCLTTGWLLASVLTPPVVRVQELPERRPAQSRGDSEPLAPFTEQLQVRLRQAPQPPTPRRNPFAFGHRQLTSDDSTRARVAPRLPEALVAPPVVGPAFRLSGVGVRDTANGPIHTAVLSDSHTVHLLNTGDVIGGYQVLEVNDNSVTLADASGARYVLRLR